MLNLPRFHQLVGELLNSIGFELGAPPESQDLFSLSVDQAYTLHLGMMDDDTCFILAELPEPVKADAPLADWLRANAITEDKLQAVVALDEHDRPCCYLRFHIEGFDLPELLTAFNLMLCKADDLCAKGS